MKRKNDRHIIWGLLISMAILVLQMVVALFKVRIILSNYGYEYYSIFQSSNGIFSYLILIESGFSVAYLLKMYEPYAKRDYRKVQSLYIGLRHMLCKTATIMLIGVVVITIFYPLILADSKLENLEIRVLIALCGLKFVLPYFFTVAKKQILTVVEKSYFISIIDSSVNLMTDIIVICIACFTHWNFTSIVLTSVLMLIPSIMIYTYILHYYEKKLNFASDVTPSYEGSSMTKDIMAQKIAYLADNNVDQIILSTRDLLQTTIYTSFGSVVSYPVSLINQLISSFRGHMGVMLASNAESSFTTFRNLLSINYYIATVITCEFIIQAQFFVKLWIGAVYSTENITIILFAIILFRKCAENAITIAREGRNLYKESKRYALMAATINLVLSLFLVQFFEIKGLLIATIIADVFFLDINNYRMTFHKIFNKKVDIFYELLPSVFCLLGAAMFRYYSPFKNIDQSSWLQFVGYSFVIAVSVSCIVGALYLIFSRYMRSVILCFIPESLMTKFKKWTRKMRM